MLRTTAALAAVLAVSPLAEAGGIGDLIPRMGIFRKKNDVPANDKDKAVKVKGLLDTLKSDPDVKKRTEAAEALRDYDPRAHTDSVAALVTALKTDPAPEVRSEAATSLGAIKSISQQAGVALEQTNASDPSEAVRKSAQAALWQYHVNGYKSAGPTPTQPQTAEPPLAKPRDVTVLPKTLPAIPVPTPLKANTVTATTTSTTGPVKAKGGIYPQTVEPPLAKPKESTVVVPEVVVPPSPSLNVPPLPTVPTVPGVPSPSTSPGVPPPQ